MAATTINIVEAIQRQVSNREGTMYSLATSTTLESLDKLRRRYGLTQMTLDSLEEQRLWNELLAFVEEQVRARRGDAFYDDYPTALRALRGRYRNEMGNEMVIQQNFGYYNNQQPSFILVRIGLKNIVALLWEATKHEEHLQRGVTIADARDALIRMIANGHRGNNRNNEIGIDDRSLADTPVCGKGYFNQIGECWRSIHQDTGEIILNLEASIPKSINVQYCKRLLVLCGMDLARAINVLAIIQHEQFDMDIRVENLAMLGLGYTLDDIRLAVEFSRRLNPKSYPNPDVFVNTVIREILEDPEFNARSEAIKAAIREELNSKWHAHILHISEIGATPEDLRDVLRNVYGIQPVVVPQEVQAQKVVTQGLRQDSDLIRVRRELEVAKQTVKRQAIELETIRPQAEAAATFRAELIRAQQIAHSQMAELANFRRFLEIARHQAAVSEVEVARLRAELEAVRHRQLAVTADMQQDAASGQAAISGQAAASGIVSAADSAPYLSAVAPAPYLPAAAPALFLGLDSYFTAAGAYRQEGEGSSSRIEERRRILEEDIRRFQSNRR